MCLGIPGRVVKLLDGHEGQLALVDVLGAARQVNVGLLEGEPLQPGDWVAIHIGFALERIETEEAEEALRGLELMGRPREAVPEPSRSNLGRSHLSRRVVDG